MDIKDFSQKNQEPSASAREIFDDRQPFLPRQKLGAGTAEYLGEADRPAGRYRSPLSRYNQLALRLRQKISELGEFHDSFTFRDPAYPVSTSWQIILNHLFEEKILASPRAVFEPPFNDEPKLFYVHLLPCFDRARTDGHDPQSVYSRGSSLSFEEALSKATGELLERYTLSQYKIRDLTKASPGVLRRKNILHLEPAELAPFSEKQKEMFSSRRWNEDSEFFWVKGRELGVGSMVFIPAQLVFWNYCGHGEEPYLWQPITNGAAGHFSREEALISGIYELVQRDAFLIHWLNRIAPRRVDIFSTQNTEIRALLDFCQRYRLEVNVLNTTTDIPIPSFVTAITDHSGQGPALTIGGGCDLNPEKAVIQSVTESLGVRHWLRRHREDSHDKIPSPILSTYVPFREEIGQQGRLLLWSRQEMLPHFAFFLEGRTQQLQEIQSEAFASPKDELGFLQKTIEHLGPEYRIYFYEARHPVLCTLGYAAMRVIIPSLLPLYLRENAATLGAVRLKTVAEKLGRGPAAAYNPLPHPFP